MKIALRHTYGTKLKGHFNFSYPTFLPGDAATIEKPVINYNGPNVMLIIQLLLFRQSLLKCPSSTEEGSFKFTPVE